VVVVEVSMQGNASFVVIVGAVAVGLALGDGWWCSTAGWGQCIRCSDRSIL
jgi:hypothetical protein